MIRKMRLRLVIAFIMLSISALSYAQKTNSSNKDELTHRIKPAPESVFKMFREAGMKPANRTLTIAEKEKVRNAFAHLTPLHQRILKQHLGSISFMDNMPNTALTSPVDTGGATKMFNITFRASLLDENISQWVTWKENPLAKQRLDQLSSFYRP